MNDIETTTDPRIALLEYQHRLVGRARRRTIRKVHEASGAPVSADAPELIDWNAYESALTQAVAFVEGTFLRGPQTLLSIVREGKRLEGALKDVQQREASAREQMEKAEAQLGQRLHEYRDVGQRTRVEEEGFGKRIAKMAEPCAPH